MTKRRDGSGAYTVSDEDGLREVKARRKRGAEFADDAGNTPGGERSVFDQVEANSGENGFSGAIRKG